jgi:hypothetical protein
LAPGPQMTMHWQMQDWATPLAACQLSCTPVEPCITQAYNWGYTGVGRVWYSGGWGSGGWGGGYFGGSCNSYNWGAATLNRFNRYGGTGGNGAWFNNGWGGGWGGYGRGLRRALLQDGGETSAVVSRLATAGPGLKPPVRDEARIVAAVIDAQLEAGRLTPPVCVASAASCAAAAAASCPRGVEPRVALAARLVKSGALAQQGAAGLAFAAPSLAVGRNGTMLIVATYSGSGKIKGSAAPAYPGRLSACLRAQRPQVDGGQGGLKSPGLS